MVYGFSGSLFNPSDFYNVSDMIYSNLIFSKEQSCYRASIGRLYYAAFLNLRKEVELDPRYIKFQNETRYRDHELLIKFLLTLGSKYSFISNQLEKLRTLRNDADYALSISIVDADFKNALSLYKIIKVKSNELGISFD